MVSGMAQGGTTAWPGTTTALEKMVVPAADGLDDWTG